MKNKINFIIGLIFILVIGFIIIIETNKQDEVPDFLLGKATVGSIKVTRRINGKISPSEEVKVKSRISGILDEVFVEIGQKVTKGDRIAVIKNLSEPMDIENFRSNVSVLEIQLTNAEQAYLRDKKLFSCKIIAKANFERTEARYNELNEQLRSAKKRLQMATSGFSTLDKELSNTIYAPISGTILNLLNKPGTPVIKQNNFNEGTDVATIADMSALKFYGKINERDLGTIFKGQKLAIKTIVLGDSTLSGFVEKIYPKGNDENGIVKFSMEAKLDHKNVHLFGGISGTAIAIVDQKDSILCIEEKYLIYEKDSCYVLKRQKDGGYQKAQITIGISDGNKTEIIMGLNKKDKVKLPDEVE